MDQRSEEMMARIQGWADMHDYVVRKDSAYLYIDNVTTKHAVWFNNWNDRTLKMPGQMDGSWGWRPNANNHNFYMPLVNLSKRIG